MPRRRSAAPALALSLILTTPALAAKLDAERIPAAGLIRVMGRSGIAHACPAGGQLLTAAHVIEDEHHTAPAGGVPIAWEDQAGHGGWAAMKEGDSARDVVVLEALPETPPLPSFTYPLAESFRVGEPVIIIGYRFSGDHPTEPILVRAKITGSIAGHVFYDHTPGEGSSGGCVLNERREVIAVNTGGLLNRKGDEIIAGFGVLVIGIWRMNEPPKEAKPAPAKPEEIPMGSLIAAAPKGLPDRQQPQ